jgi:hypothetical protein
MTRYLGRYLQGDLLTEVLRTPSKLEEGAKPVITTLYRHPNKFKDEIEKAIKELLDMGHIRPSSDPLSSPILLVKKKDRDNENVYLLLGLE